MKVPVQAIHFCPYIKEPGEFSPNYLLLGEKKISRVNVIGVVVGVEDASNTFIIDDGHRISVRGFDKLPLLSVGDIVNVIGRPREFNNEKYLVPEIIRKTSEKWMRVWKAETSGIKVEKHEEVVAEQGESLHDKVYEFIKKSDTGHGVDVDAVLGSFGEESEGILSLMMKEGEIFENMPGKVKVLE